MPLSLNKQKEKEWDSFLKQEAKNFGWKFKGWFAYKVINDFFYKVSFYTSANDNSISGSLQFKPLIIDDTFWQIVHLLENKKMPVSFRGNGAFVVHSKEVFDFKLRVVHDDLQSDIKDLLTKINSHVAELQSSITNLDSFITYVERHPSKRSEWFDSDLLIVTSIVQKKYDKALALLDYAKKNSGMCSWSFGDKDFYDLAIEYCQDRLAYK